MNTRSALKRKAALERVNLPQAQTLFPIASSSSKSPMNVPKLPSNQIQPSAAQIRRRLATLFPRGGLAENRPAVLARIFACYSLVEGFLSDNSDKDDDKSFLLMNLFASFVHVEAVSLGDMDQPSSPQKRRRVVHFNGFDSSSTLPPVDREGGATDSHQQESIDAMMEATNRVKAFVAGAAAEQQNRNSQVENQQSSSSDKDDLTKCLEQFLAFIGEGSALRTLGKEGEYSLLRECAAAVEDGYPMERVVKIASDCYEDFEVILQRIKTGNVGPFLRLEQRFAEFVGQNIRWGLRKLHNGALPMITTENTAYEERISSFSQVEQKITMFTKESKAAGDGCISAIVSTALYRLCVFFDLEHFLDDSTADRKPNLPSAFFAKPASNLRFKPRGPAQQLSDEQLQDVLADMREAYSFLAAAAACKFLCKLWTIDGVKEEISRLGGWSMIENSAGMSFTYELWRVCPLDTHLVLLRDHTSLLKRLESYQTTMEKKANSCRKLLNDVKKRFFVETSSTNMLGKYPQIRELAACAMDGDETLAAIPNIRRRPKTKKVTAF